MMIQLREELAALHRQVESLGKSLQPATTPSPSAYQAPSTHGSTASRDVPHTTPNTRPDNTRADAARYTDYGDPSLPSIRPNGIDRNNDQAVRTVRQDSRTSLHQDTVNTEDITANNYAELTPTQDDIQDPETIHKEEEKQMEVEHNQEYEKEPQYEEGNFNYDQSYEQAPVTADTEYQNQQYQENYEQPAYTEQYENYEQYPQQYVDPNAQYEGQYENYGTDGNYANQQNYDNTGYNQEYGTENQIANDQISQEQNVVSESKRSNSPNAKVYSQS